MPKTADAAGRIKCRTCGNTLLWLQEGLVRWEARIRPGQRRTFEIRADSPALKDVLVSCERCGTQWVPQPLEQAGATLRPLVAGVLKAVTA